MQCEKKEENILREVRTFPKDYQICVYALSILKMHLLFIIYQLV